MYGQYKEDLGRFARTHAQKLIDGKLQKRERKFILPEKYQRKLTGLFLFYFTLSLCDQYCSGFFLFSSLLEKF